MRCVFVQFVHDGCYIRQHKEVSWKYIHMITTAAAAAATAAVAVAGNKIRKEKVRRKLNDIFHKPISFRYVLKYLYG